MLFPLGFSSPDPPSHYPFRMGGHFYNPHSTLTQPTLPFSGTDFRLSFPPVQRPVFFGSPGFPVPTVTLPFPSELHSPLVSSASSSSPRKSPHSASARIFRPWLTEEDISSTDERTPPIETSREIAGLVKREVGSPLLGHPPATTLLPPSVPHQPKVCGSRNSKVAVRDDDPFLRQQSALEIIATNLGKSGDGGHRCIYCGKVYSRKYGLKIHLRTHTGFKPLKCKVCDRAFGDPSNLNKHTRLHSENGLSVKCHLCGKVLVRKRDLERHMVSRHESIPLPQSHMDSSTASSDMEDSIDVDNP